MSIRAVLFDWGGTLVREQQLVTSYPAGAVAAYGRKHLHFALRDADFERALEAVMPDRDPAPGEPAPSIHAIIASAFTWLGWTVGTSDVDACARLFFDAAYEGYTVYDDARALLPSLRYRDYRTGIVTNSIFPARLLEVKVNQLGLAGYLDCIVSSADVGLAKPHPGIYQKALAELAVESHEALFVGDRVETDVAGARAAGLRAVLLQRNGRPREAAGYLVVERLGALNEILGEV
ncbi:MAG: HAD family hydrolase [Dehalococcoidia bacterium]|nr:MAG: HAD family hydrolase [bacterium]MCK6564319.1 HAD family hydrolase [Dehalococcoidia bacterium]MCL4231462.1 HAD family hydrolase [Dehalococcoidia bacterium]NUQ54587.1 HAD family hydrolase [Dehalococcoidia bacterium]RIL03720.1 MAG: hypothetical protein DCC78_02915 [bacterium]